MANPSSFHAIDDKSSTLVSRDLRGMVRRLTILAVNGLASMFDRERHLFCLTLKQTEHGMVREGISRRYTMMALMGLRRLEEGGETSPVAIGPVVDRLLANLDWIDNAGDLGVLLWLCALVAPERLAEVERRTNIRQVLPKYRQTRQGRTMELALFLAGLSHAWLARKEMPSELQDVAIQTYRTLIKNQGEQGLFAHLASNGSASGMLRGNIGSFADQAFAIYAMTKFFQAYGDKAALERALDCTLMICEAQGSLGQWWWHYDSSSGRVAGRFPVFSVHQHGLAPMALLELGKTIQSDFTPWIQKGLQWIRVNELAFDMEDVTANVVWRGMCRTLPTRVWSTAMALLAQREDPASRHGLKIMFECHPCELGWLLYAFGSHVNA
jgi:hypothetical protein